MENLPLYRDDKIIVNLKQKIILDNNYSQLAIIIVYLYGFVKGVGKINELFVHRIVNGDIADRSLRRIRRVG